MRQLCLVLIAAVIFAGCTADPPQGDATPTPSDQAAATPTPPQEPPAEPAPSDAADTGGECGHDVDASIVSTGYNVVIDALGSVQHAQGRPIAEGYELRSTPSYVDDHNDREYAEIFAHMAPIRDALMCDMDSTDAAAWEALTEVLTINGIRTHQDLSGRPNEHVYSSQGIFEHLKSGPDHHPMMKYLEEAELELKCLAFVDFNFTNPEGQNHCETHGLDEGAGYARPA